MASLARLPRNEAKYGVALDRQEPFGNSVADESPILLRQIAKDIGLTVDELLKHR